MKTIEIDLTMVRKEQTEENLVISFWIINLAVKGHNKIPVFLDRFSNTPMMEALAQKVTIRKPLII